MIWRRRKRAWPFRRFGSRPKSVQSDESSRLFSFLIYSVSSPPPVQFSCISFKNFGGIRKRRRPPSLTWRRVNNKMGRSHPLAAGRFSSDGSTTRLKRKKKLFCFLPRPFLPRALLPYCSKTVGYNIHDRNN